MIKISAWISVLGLYNYDNTVFDEFVIPEQLDKETLVEEIMARFAELEVVYPNPDSFKRILKFWSNSRLKVWQHLYDTTVYKYNPLNNHNMESIGKVTGNVEYESKDDYISNTTEDNGKNRTENTHYSDNLSGDEKANDKELTKGNDAFNSVENDNNWVYGYNSANKALRNSEDDTLKSTDKWNTDKTGNDNRDWRKQEASNKGITESETENKSRWDKSGRLKADVTESVNDTVRNAEGNTGIYSRQMLIKQEREVAEFSVYEYIMRDFKKRFCIQVW